MDVKLELDDPPTHEATLQLKVGKSPDIDGIPAEVYQHGGEAVLDKLHYRRFLRMQSLPLPTKARQKNQTV